MGKRKSKSNRELSNRPNDNEVRYGTPVWWDNARISELINVVWDLLERSTITVDDARPVLESLYQETRVQYPAFDFYEGQEDG